MVNNSIYTDIDKILEEVTIYDDLYKSNKINDKILKKNL